MKTLTIRGIDEKLSEAIKKFASKNNTSINQFVLEILKKAAGLEKKPEFKNYDDLDHLAGTWSKSDLNEFEENTKQFIKIDKEIWK